MTSLDSRLIQVAAVIAAALLCVALVTYPSQDYDLFWHLAYGREMLAQGRILNAEVFSFTRAGVAFSNHEWLTQVLMYEVFSRWGLAGLNVVDVVVSLGIAAIAYFTGRRVGAAPVHAAGLCVAALLVGYSRYNVRPELFSLLFVALLSFLLHGYRAGITHARALIAIPFIMVLWDWLHGAVFGVVILGAFATSENAKRWIGPRFPALPGCQPMTPARIRVLNLAAAGTVIVMLLNPYGLLSYDIFLEFFRENPLVKIVEEFQPPSWSTTPEYFVFVAISLVVIGLRWRALDLSSVLCAGPFLLLSLRHTRVAAVMALLMIPVLAGLLAADAVRADARRGAVWLRNASAALIALMMIMYTVNIRFIEEIPGRWTGIADVESYSPVGSVRFVLANHLAGNLYNTGNIGGYLAYYLAPERRIFQFNHHAVFGDTMRFTRDPDALRPWNINYAIVSTPSELATLFPRSDWATVYREPTGVVFVRRTPENQPLIAEFELRYFHLALPDAKLLGMAVDPGARPRLMLEIARYLAYRTDTRVCALLSNILAGPGRFDADAPRTMSAVLSSGPAGNECTLAF